MCLAPTPGAPACSRTVGVGTEGGGNTTGCEDTDCEESAVDLRESRAVGIGGGGREVVLLPGLGLLCVWGVVVSGGGELVRRGRLPEVLAAPVCVHVCVFVCCARVCVVCVCVRVF